MAGTISFDGLATGINTTETVDQLMDVASRPKLLKQAELVRAENELAAWQEVNTRLLSLRTSTQDLWKLSSWNTLTGESSNESILTATTSASAKSGKYTFTVESLAKNHQIASGSFADELSSVGSGDITLTRGDESTTITLDATNNTLSGLADAINTAKIGVSASVINEGGSYRLLLSSDETGVENAISITRDNTVDIFYQRTPEDKSVTAYTELQAAADASLKFGSSADALTITSASNEVDDLVEGVTLNLVSASPGTEVTLNLVRDTSAVEETIQGFVDTYNEAIEFINQQFEFDEDAESGGILMGDRTLVSIQEQILNLASGSVATGGSYTTLRSVGLELQDDGTLEFDAATFQDAVASDYAAVQDLFRTSGSSDHSKVAFVYAGKTAVEPSSSGYEVVITAAAEKATLTAGSNAALTITDGVNDTLTLAVDGSESFSVTLTAGTYTIAALAEELQDKINSGTTAGSEVSVSVSGGTKLQITSELYGSGSQLQLLGGTALTDLGFSLNDTDAGANVAGTINGETANGSGQSLIGAAGNQTTAGVTLQIDLTASDLTDAGGSVSTQLYFSKGIGNKFDEYLQRLTTPLIGTLDMQEEELNETIKGIEETIVDMEERLEAERESLLEQFYRMESAVAELNSQGNYLMNTLGSLSNNWSWNS